ncbi:MAG TPA: transketolase [Acidimicrobiia bacterium]|nr:transketolase [Acidimicrobiia bacterium]
MTRSIEQRAADTIRALSMDAVEKANSGHPGMPMGMADIAVVLWSRYLTVDPDAPTWRDRDRFVVSNGHGSMLLYSLLHLSGFPLTMDEIENFRQWGYETAGHPEHHPGIGIETTTGPLGQGFGTAVGMAIAEEHLRSIHGEELVDHRTFVFCSDGDLMEGVSSEASSVAGHLGLGRLTVFYDDNSITIDGSTDIAFTEDVPARFAAYGWHTITVDGHDRKAIASGIDEALAVADRPTLISCKTHIGFGAPNKANSASAHGSPLGADEIALAKDAMDWDLPPFRVPDDVYSFFRDAMDRGRRARLAWEDRRAAIRAVDPVRTEAFDTWWDPKAVALDPPDTGTSSSMATRKLSEAVIQELASARPDVLGSSADLAGSNNTLIASSGYFSRDDRAGRNLAFGIREHAMGTAINGITLHGGLRAFGGTFLTFSDYMRPAVRLAALMGVPSIFVWTHDSVFLGEDGPTHQPIEHLPSLRAIPNLDVIRPADPVETAMAWQHAMNRLSGPTCLILTRQGLPIPASNADPSLVARGGYVRKDGAEVVLIATGSEVPLAESVAEVLSGEISVRVVSMPCVEEFERQDEAYRIHVLGEDMPTFTLEAAATFGWSSYTTRGGIAIGIDRFGVSAPAAVLAEELGFTPEAIAEVIRQAGHQRRQIGST